MHFTPSNSRSLHMSFIVEGSEQLSSTDFVSLFECTDSFCRAVAENEVSSFIEQLNLSSDVRFDMISRLHRLGRRFPAPAAVETIERGSWHIGVAMTGAATLYILRNTLGPTMREAWDESRMREAVLQFLREHIFMGARRKVEEVAVGRSRWGNLRIRGVEETALGSSGPRVTISLQRTEVVEVQISDQELIDELVKRFPNR